MVLSSVKQDGGELAFLRIRSITAAYSRKWQFKFVCHLLSHTKGRRESTSGKGQPAAPYHRRSSFLPCKGAGAPLDEHCPLTLFPGNSAYLSLWREGKLSRGPAQSRLLTSHWRNLVICQLLNQSLVRDIELPGLARNQSGLNSESPYSE